MLITHAFFAVSWVPLSPPLDSRSRTKLSLGSPTPLSRISKQRLRRVDMTPHGRKSPTRQRAISLSRTMERISSPQGVISTISYTLMVRTNAPRASSVYHSFPSTSATIDNPCFNICEGNTQGHSVRISDIRSLDRVTDKCPTPNDPIESYFSVCFTRCHKFPVSVLNVVFSTSALMSNHSSMCQISASGSNAQTDLSSNSES